MITNGFIKLKDTENLQDHFWKDLNIFKCVTPSAEVFCLLLTTTVSKTGRTNTEPTWGPMTPPNSCLVNHLTTIQTSTRMTWSGHLAVDMYGWSKVVRWPLTLACMWLWWKQTCFCCRWQQLTEPDSSPADPAEEEALPRTLLHGVRLRRRPEGLSL